MIWLIYRALNKPLPVPHAAGWMMIPEHSVEQVLETGALRSLYPHDVLEAEGGGVAGRLQLADLVLAPQPEARS